MADPADATPVRCEDAGGGVLVATLDRGPANALGPPIVEGLAAVVDEAHRAEARALVIDSAVPRFFTAGEAAEGLAAFLEKRAPRFR